MLKLTEAEWSALDLAERATLISRIPDNTEVDPLGGVTPGLRVIRRLEKAGLLYVTEEDPLDLGNGTLFEFTPSVELTEEGRVTLDRLRNQSRP